MATKPEPTKAEAEETVKKPGKSKKILVLGLVVVLVLVLGGGAAWFWLKRHNTGEDGETPLAQSEPKGPPTFFPLENMVVNLADPGGEKVAQIGITLELSDSKAVEKVKMYLPSIRSDVLLLISQRTADELLQIEGKEKLAADILRQASRPFEDSPGVNKKASVDPTRIRKKSLDHGVSDDNPIRGVLFSSFIVQ